LRGILWKANLGLCLLAICLAACGPVGRATEVFKAFPPVQTGPPQQPVPPTLTPLQPEDFTPPPLPTNTVPPGQPTPTALSRSLWISNAVPEPLRQAALAAALPAAGSAEAASLRLDAANSDAQVHSTWVYALAAPFPTIQDDVKLADLRQLWNGDPAGPYAGHNLWMEEATLQAFTVLWGAPADGVIKSSPSESLVDSAWAGRPAAWAIVPFEELQPRWKVISVEGQSPIRNNFDPAQYPLKVQFSLQASSSGVDLSDVRLPASNREAQLLTNLDMTGVTALVRATADSMEKHGILYPGEEVRSVLRMADLTHISNEVSFDPNCPTPDPWTDSLQFCSNPAYMALLEDIGVDIVELTGNHLLDYGPADFSSTLDIYDQQGLKYFGGGRDLAASVQPLLIMDHGNELAFIGCNYAGPPGDWATESRPGSAPCDFEAMHAEITNLLGQGVLPIVTLQYNEYYQSWPTDYEQRDFRSMAEAGAVIVSGSQAHMPASMEFNGNAFIHYGLGNLFFDQMSHLMPDGSVIYDTRNVFIDRHVFYGGRYLGVELLTYIIEDYARPRLMTPVERVNFLQKLFSAGGW
jgi:hypothetical protein